MKKLFKKWNPGDAINNHDGTSIESKHIFIVPPPEEIGKLLSASSTFSKFQPIFLFKLFVRYFALVGKFVHISFFLSVIALISFWIINIWDIESNVTLSLIANILMILVLPGLFNGILYYLYLNIFLRKIYYIGTQGIGIFSFTLPFKREWLKCQVFLYNEIKSVEIEQTRHYVRQLSTRYKYTKGSATIYGRNKLKCGNGDEILFLDTLKKHFNEYGKVFSNHPINFYLKVKQMLLLYQSQKPSQ